jgi:hypothetical protein
LSGLLSQVFQSVQVEPSLDLLRKRVAKQRIETVVLDMEVASVSDVESLTREFPELAIVCTHRLADDELWTATLGAGAVDCCDSFDREGIVRAATRRMAARQAA